MGSSLLILSYTQATDAQGTRGEGERVTLVLHFPLKFLYHSWYPMFSYLLPVPSASPSLQGKLWAKEPWLLLTTDVSRGPQALGLSLAAHPSAFSLPSSAWNLNSCLGPLNSGQCSLTLAWSMEANIPWHRREPWQWSPLHCRSSAVSEEHAGKVRMCPAPC